jgi:hypothetical protein
MDPYLEGPSQWSDFHSTFIHALREAIGDLLPEPYFARVTELVMMVTPELPARRSVEPDLFVGRGRYASEITGGSESQTAVLEPLMLENIELLDPYTEPFIEILRLPDFEPVTIVELFSPTNKYGDGRGAYADTCNRLLRTPVNLFELDLIRAGPRLRLSRPVPDDDYLCYISRGNHRPACEVYNWSIRQKLPALPVPLKDPDPDIRVDLAQAFKVAFSRGKYGRFIDYTQSPRLPAFDEADSEWVR